MFSNNDIVETISKLEFEDSSLFGLGFDISKFYVKLGFWKSARLTSLGFDSNYNYIMIDFHDISDFSINIEKKYFSQSRIDHELASVELCDLQDSAITVSCSENRHLDCCLFRAELSLGIGRASFHFIRFEMSSFELGTLS